MAEPFAGSRLLADGRCHFGHHDQPLFVLLASRSRGRGHKSQACRGTFIAKAGSRAGGEARRWPVGLSRQPGHAKAFYAAIVVATVVGAAGNVLSISPIKALICSAVLNAIVAVPVMALLMRMGTNAKIMGKFKVSGWWTILGWIATALMTVASLAFLLSLALPIRDK
jgi:Mn2+/Fe2+ NRAMP family transporter